MNDHSDIAVEAPERQTESWDPDLEQYRDARQLSYQQLADQIGLPSASHARKIAVGMSWPVPETVQLIIEKTGITVGALHRRRLAHVRGASSA